MQEVKHIRKPEKLPAKTGQLLPIEEALAFYKAMEEQVDRNALEIDHTKAEMSRTK